MSQQPQPRHLQWRFIVAIVNLAAIWLTVLVDGRCPVDRAIYEDLYAGHRPLLLGIARVFTAFGEPTVLIAACVACALWLWRTGRGRLGLVLLLIALVGRGLSEAQK